MRWIVLTLCLGLPSWTYAQRCAPGDIECQSDGLDVSEAQLTEAAQRVVELRRIARDRRGSPGTRVAAMRQLADLLASIAHRVIRASTLGVLEPAAWAALTRIVGQGPALDSGRTARRCLELARRTFAWGPDALRCEALLDRPATLGDHLALPALPEAFVRSHGDAARALYAATQLLVRQGSADGHRQLAAMQIVLGDTSGAVATLEGQPRQTWQARLAWAEALAAAGRGAEALPMLQALSRESPVHLDAITDHVHVLNALRQPSDRASASQVLAGAQHYLCTTEPGTGDYTREVMHSIGAEAASDLGLPEMRPIVPVEHLDFSDASQQRPLATCRRAARNYLQGRVLAAPVVPTAEPCPDSQQVVWGLDEQDVAGWVLRRGRLVRVPQHCLPNEPDADEATFALGALGEAVVSDHVQGAYVVGREVRGTNIGVLRDPSMRFGTDVVSAGDVNHDGLPDLLVTRPAACDCCDCSGSTDDVLLYLGQASGPPRLAMTLQGPDGLQNWIQVLAIGDENRDGFDDVAIAHGNEIRVHRGSVSGLAPVGRLVHRRRDSSDGLTWQRSPRGWWWVDSDVGQAFVVRGRRAHRVRLP